MGIKVLIGIGIIVASFGYVLKNNTSMLDNLLEKSREDYEKQEAIKQKAHEVVDGKTDAFDALTEGVKNFSEPLLRDAVQKEKTEEK